MKAETNGKMLFPPQREVIDAGLLEESRHLLLNMATGSGKTFLAELAIESVVQSGYKAVYLTPLKALASQQQREWAKRFPGVTIGVFTGDTLQMTKSEHSYQESQILIMTPERMDACLRSWRRHWDWLPEISLAVIDEFHLLGQDVRGARLEGIMTRLMRLNPFARFIGLSATMPNAEELAEWLHGSYYQSTWRQVPLEKTFERFSSTKDKPQLLLRTVRCCTEDGGQSLVFCNSRKRAQEMADYLTENGIPAGCHHAGLMPEQREKAENDFRSGATRVLVATSTLEMGLNIPAQQVVIYDTYAFTRCGLADLPVWSYIQRAGRAGRPGLDTRGEAVMLLPKWVSNRKYQQEQCESVDSQLIHRQFMQEQILIEVFAGFSRTARELSEGFLPMTLYKAQHEEAEIKGMVNSLLMGDLLYETEETGNVLDRPLKVGLLGKLAVKLMLSVETVRTVKEIYAAGKRLYLFDILLTATLCADCEPVLPANYEETNWLCKIVRPLPSSLMNGSMEKLRKLLPEGTEPKRILAAIKMAAICHCLTTEMSIEEVAKNFMIYMADIYALRENVIRLLQGMEAILSAIDKKELGDEDASKRKEEHGSPYRLTKMLSDMLRYRLSSELATLTQLSGVGGHRARALADEGFRSVEDIATAKPAELKNVDGIGEKLSDRIVKEAEELCKQGSARIYREESIPVAAQTDEIYSSIDPYRLIRSTELIVSNAEGNHYLVCGGREDHIIEKHGAEYRCDCMDFQENHGNCKHILCVRREDGDAEVLRALTKLQGKERKPIRDALPNLWKSAAGRKKQWTR